MPIVHEHDAAFDDRNLFLQALLGLVSYCRRYETLLARCGPSSIPSYAQCNDALLDAALGLASFANHVIDALHDAGVAPCMEQPPVQSSLSPLRGLLD